MLGMTGEVRSDWKDRDDRKGRNNKERVVIGYQNPKIEKEIECNERTS